MAKLNVHTAMVCILYTTLFPVARKIELDSQRGI